MPQQDQSQKENKYRQLKPAGPPKGWRHHNPELSPLLIPHTIIVASLDPEGMNSGRQLGQGKLMDASQKDPVFIDSVNFIGILIPGGIRIIQGRELQVQRKIPITYPDFSLPEGKGFSFPVFSEYRHIGHRHRGYPEIVFQPAREKGDQSVDPSKIHLTIPGPGTGPGIEFPQFKIIDQQERLKFRGLGIKTAHRFGCAQP